MQILDLKVEGSNANLCLGQRSNGHGFIINKELERQAYAVEELWPSQEMEILDGLLCDLVLYHWPLWTTHCPRNTRSWAGSEESIWLKS